MFTAALIILAFTVGVIVGDVRASTINEDIAMLHAKVDAIRSKIAHVTPSVKMVAAGDVTAAETTINEAKKIL